MFNERHVVRRILGAAAALDWPQDKLTIQLLDDSIDETREIAEAAVQELRAAGVDAHRLHRVDRTGFKAGALHAGLGVTDHPYVAMFDADFIPRPDFLRRTVGVLENDKRLAFVQGRWEHLNGDENRLTRAQTLMLDAHFGVEQPARSMTGLPLPFNGTCGIWRRAAIDDAGGWKADTLTEDLDLSLRAHLKGWRARYLSDITVPGELPSSIAAWRVQQFRWTKGFAQVACKLLPTVWRSTLPRKTKVVVTLQLLQCLFYPLGALAMVNTLMFLSIGFDQPVALTVLGVVSTVLGISGTAAFLISGRCAVRRERLGQAAMDILATMALNAGLSLSNSVGVIEAFLGRRSGFVRTPKKGSSRRVRLPQRRRQRHPRDGGRRGAARHGADRPGLVSAVPGRVRHRAPDHGHRPAGRALRPAARPARPAPHHAGREAGAAGGPGAAAELAQLTSRRAGRSVPARLFFVPS